MKLKITLIGLVIFLLKTAPLLASDDQIPFASRVPYRIARGATNIAFGWTEIFLRPFVERQTESVGQSLSKGGIHTVLRLAVGLTDITTFWDPDLLIFDLYPDGESWPYLFHGS